MLRANLSILVTISTLPARVKSRSVCRLSAAVHRRAADLLRSHNLTACSLQCQDLDFPGLGQCCSLAHSPALPCHPPVVRFESQTAKLYCPIIEFNLNRTGFDLFSLAPSGCTLLCCTDQQLCAVSPRSDILREANVHRPPKLEHAVQRGDSNGHLGHLPPFGPRA